MGCRGRAPLACGQGAPTLSAPTTGSLEPERQHASASARKAAGTKRERRHYPTACRPALCTVGLNPGREVRHHGRHEGKKKGDVSCQSRKRPWAAGTKGGDGAASRGGGSALLPSEFCQRPPPRRRHPECRVKMAPIDLNRRIDISMRLSVSFNLRHGGPPGAWPMVQQRQGRAAGAPVQGSSVDTVTPLPPKDWGPTGGAQLTGLSSTDGTRAQPVGLNWRGTWAAFLLCGPPPHTHVSLSGRLLDFAFWGGCPQPPGCIRPCRGDPPLAWA